MRSIIIDTDPGIDDAVAISIALNNKNLDVKLISTVGGNAGIEKTSINAAKLIRFFGLEEKIPVVKGAKSPLIQKITNAKDVHGDSGMDGYDFPSVDDFKFLEGHSINAMRNTILNNSQKTTIVAIGPLTNIALLIKVYPEVIDKIDEIVIMGGSLNRGNKDVMAEFNIYWDPEAAQLVINSGIKVVFATLDVGILAPILPEDSEKFKAKNETGKMIYSLFKQYRGGSLQTGLKMYDCHAIAYLLCPEIFDIKFVYGEVELSGKLTRGCTVFDLKNYLNKESNVYVTENVDSIKFREFLVNEICNCNK